MKQDALLHNFFKVLTLPVLKADRIKTLLFYLWVFPNPIYQSLFNHIPVSNYCVANCSIDYPFLSFILFAGLLTSSLKFCKVSLHSISFKLHLEAITCSYFRSILGGHYSFCQEQFNSLPFSTFVIIVDRHGSRLIWSNFLVMFCPSSHECKHVKAGLRWRLNLNLWWQVILVTETLMRREKDLKISSFA